MEGEKQQGLPHIGLVKELSTAAHYVDFSPLSIVSLSLFPIPAANRHRHGAMERHFCVARAQQQYLLLDFLSLPPSLDSFPPTTTAHPCALDVDAPFPEQRNSGETGGEKEAIEWEGKRGEDWEKTTAETEGRGTGRANGDDVFGTGDGGEK